MDTNASHSAGTDVEIYSRSSPKGRHANGCLSKPSIRQSVFSKKASTAHQSQ